MRALASAVVAAAILILGAGPLDQASAAPGGAKYAARGGPNQRHGWNNAGWRGSRGWGWRGPGVWWGAGFGWGPRWWGPGFYGYGYPGYPYGGYYPYAYPYAAPPAVVVQPNPQVYIEQAPQAVAPPLVSTPPAAAALPQAPSYWYYCAESQAYYPYVRECPAGWMTVVPPSTAPAP